MFGTAVEALRAQTPWPMGAGVADAAVVAVGYPTDAPYDSVRRSWDYSPPPGATYPPHTPQGPDVRTGGAETFLTFLEEELKPEIARRVRTDPARSALFGHSFGGLFALYALFRRPEAFSRWIAVSPSVYWENFTLLRFAEAFEASADRPTDLRVLISVGEYEEAPAPFPLDAADAEKRRAVQASARIETHARAMHTRLSALDGITSEFELIGGETHMSVLPTAINQAIRFAFGTWR
ncbi:esterase [Methylopila turkensis]|uniref:Esterase n=1 Tax=Methylopila turkensis TaxID=1437816 RepID=A0A9W6N6P6_9HYPH|nr:esterase [Methylopila turkensis]